jgi:uncharacterized protein
MQTSRFAPIALALIAGAGLTYFVSQESPASVRASNDSFTRTDLNDVVIGHPDGTLVRVAGEGEVTVVPDVAVTDAGFLFEAPTADAAQRDVNERVSRYLRALKRLGIPDSRIQTVGYTVRPRYDYSDNRARNPRIVGYIARNTVRVRSEIGQLDEVIDEANNNGVDEILRIVFEVEDEEGAFLDALALATERARGRADRVAKALGGTVTQIVEVREPTRDSFGPVPYARTGVESLASDASREEVLAPGEKTIRASVEFSAVIVVE